MEAPTANRNVALFIVALKETKTAKTNNNKTERHFIVFRFPSGANKVSSATQFRLVLCSANLNGLIY